MMPRKRRGRGEGSVYQRADGLWVGSVSAGYKADGSRNRRTAYGKTKREVQEKLRDIERAGIVADVGKLTVAQYMTLWLNDVAKGNVAASTWRRYERLARLQITPTIGHLRVSKLAPAHVQHLFAELRRRGASLSTQQKAGGLLNTALRHAVRTKLICSNPCADIERKPRAPKREMTVYDAEQADQFLNASKGERLHALYVMAIASGMRAGELFGMKWKDIDFDAACVLVQRTLEEVNGQFTLKEPKSARSRRRIDLPKFALDALAEHRAKMLAEGNIGATVFCDVKGGFLRMSNVRRRSFLPNIERAGLPVIRFHDLRHTAATLLLLAGENVKVVSERLGHASVEITLNIYAHVLPTMQKAAAKKLDRMFG